jgi:Protein of unknown function (DUF1569)
MRTMWDAASAGQIRERVARLTPERPRQWGRMSVQQMVCHLSESLRMAIGDLQVAPKRLPIRYAPLKQLIVYLIPFPKNAPTAPELTIAATSRPWADDIALLQQLIDRFAARPADAVWPDHPAFGRLSRRAWGVLAYRHMDHHLRQFGV